MKGYKLFRTDRSATGKTKKREGGLITYIRDCCSSSCEQLDSLVMSNEYMEAQWIHLHRLQCKDIIICNLYRPPNGNLKKAVTYLENCLSSIN